MSVYLMYHFLRPVDNHFFLHDRLCCGIEEGGTGTQVHNQRESHRSVATLVDPLRGSGRKNSEIGCMTRVAPLRGRGGISLKSIYGNPRSSPSSVVI